jgi:hypothetical protein
MWGRNAQGLMAFTRIIKHGSGAMVGPYRQTSNKKLKIHKLTSFGFKFVVGSHVDLCIETISYKMLFGVILGRTF